MSIISNLTEAVQAIKGRSTARKAMLGDLLVDVVTDLSIRETADVTRKPVQAGFEVALGHIQKPRTISMTVIFTDPEYGPDMVVDAAMSGSLQMQFKSYQEKRDRLYRIYSDKEIISVTTHDRLFKGFVISSITDIYNNDEDLECYEGSIELVQWDVQAELIKSIEDVATAKMAYVGKL